MRHRVAGKKLGRDKDHRKALFKNLITSLILHEEIKTTEAKAKAIKRLADKLVSQARTGTLHARRIIAGFLTDQKAITKIVDVLGPRFKKRKGGFTRIVRLGPRKGDAAPMVKMELVEKDEEVQKGKREKQEGGKKEKNVDT